MVLHDQLNCPRQNIQDADQTIILEPSKILDVFNTSKKIFVVIEVLKILVNLIDTKKFDTQMCENDTFVCEIHKNLIKSNKIWSEMNEIFDLN
jgi:hypothetical protein